MPAVDVGDRTPLDQNIARQVRLGLDPEVIVATAMAETGSHNGPWTPFAF